MDEQELLDLKRKIDKSKSQVSELKGKRDNLMDTLKKKWKCSSLEQAEKKVQQLEDQIADLEEKKEEGIVELEEKYEL